MRVGKAGEAYFVTEKRELAAEKAIETEPLAAAAWDTTVDTVQAAYDRRKQHSFDSDAPEIDHTDANGQLDSSGTSHYDAEITRWPWGYDLNSIHIADVL